MKLEKFDTFWYGLLAGLLFPALLFTIYWLFSNHQIAFPIRFVRYLVVGQMLSGVIKMCGLGDLLLFYFGLNKKLDKFSKGIIASVLFYVLLVAYVSYFHEPEII